jgi:hypothetical protein
MAILDAYRRARLRSALWLQAADAGKAGDRRGA